MDLRISKKFYTEEAIKLAISDYANVLPILLNIDSDMFCLNFECDKNEEEIVSDELLNYILFKQKSIKDVI